MFLNRPGPILLKIDTVGKERMWIKTIPGKGWWSGFRIYGPQARAFDGTWKLNDIAEVR